MTESTPFGLDQARQLNRGLTEKVLDRAESDPQWRQRLIEDPEAAMREAGFPEAQQLQQMQGAGASQGGEVTGQEMIGGDPSTWGPPSCSPQWACMWWTYYWDQVGMSYLG